MPGRAVHPSGARRPYDPGMPPARPRLWARPALLAVLAVLAVLLGAPACDGDGDGGAAGDAALSSTPGGTRSFEEQDAAITVNIAATGMNIVATDVGLRTAQGQGAEFCRATAPGELEPHQAVLEKAADAEVRRRAGVALATLRQAIDQCTGGDADAVRGTLDRFNGEFRQLQQRIDVLLDPDG